MQTQISREVATSALTHITEEKVDLFAQATGDYNPIHFNQSDAEKAGFQRPIAHGALTLSLITPFVVEVVGAGATMRTLDNIVLRAPVYIGDYVFFILEVTDRRSRKNMQIISMDVTCYILSDPKQNLSEQRMAFKNVKVKVIKAI